MDKNELKKVLYLNKPVAKLLSSDKESLKYKAMVNDIEILFKIPVSDMGTNPGIFKPEMDAKLLIRWIV